MLERSAGFPRQHDSTDCKHASRIAIRESHEFVENEVNRLRLTSLPVGSTQPVSSEIARAPGLSEKLMRLEELLTLQAPRIAIRTKGRILFIRPADVVAVEARRNYVLLQLRTTSHLLHDSISATEEKLQRYGFIRIHRSVLVNSSCVTAIEPQPTGKYLVRTQPGRDYVATRNYLKNLRALAESWIGSAAFLAQNP